MVTRPVGRGAGSMTLDSVPRISYVNGSTTTNMRPVSRPYSFGHVSSQAVENDSYYMPITVIEPVLESSSRLAP